MVTSHVPVPEHPPPLQPVKVALELATAVRVTGVLSARSAEQVSPQSIPTGELVTVPRPLPDLATERVKVVTACAGVGSAITDTRRPANSGTRTNRLITKHLRSLLVARAIHQMNQLRPHHRSGLGIGRTGYSLNPESLGGWRELRDAGQRVEV
jgi:hypothetical protein